MISATNRLAGVLNVKQSTKNGLESILSLDRFCFSNAAIQVSPLILLSTLDTYINR
jgi:hypothetical protein